MQGVQVWSLIGELGSHMPHGTANNKKSPQVLEQPKAVQTVQHSVTL